MLGVPADDAAAICQQLVPCPEDLNGRDSAALRTPIGAGQLRRVRMIELTGARQDDPDFGAVPGPGGVHGDLAVVAGDYGAADGEPDA